MKKKKLNLILGRLKKAQARKILKSLQAGTFILTKPGFATA